MTEQLTTKLDQHPVRMPVRHDLSNEEIANEARKLAALTRVREKKEREFKQIQKQWKSDDEKLELDINDHRDRIEQGWDMRPTDCVVFYNDPEKGRKTIVRADNGMIVGVEAMSPLDFDRELPLETPAETMKTDGSTVTATLGADVQSGSLIVFGDDETMPTIRFSAGRLGTPMSEAIDQAAAKTKQPQIIIPGFESDDWKATALRSAAKKAMKAAGWDVVAIATLSELLKGDDVAAIKSTLAPHVKAAEKPRDLTHEELCEAFGPFDGEMHASVFGLLPKLSIPSLIKMQIGDVDVIESNDIACKLNNAAIVANWPEQARRHLDHAMDGAELHQLVALADRLSGGAK